MTTIRVAAAAPLGREGREKAPEKGGRRGDRDVAWRREKKSQEKGRGEKKTGHPTVLSITSLGGEDKEGRFTAKKREGGI